MDEPVLDLVGLVPDEQRHLVEQAGVHGLRVDQLGPGRAGQLQLVKLQGDYEDSLK